MLRLPVIIMLLTCVCVCVCIYMHYVKNQIIYDTLHFFNHVL